MLFDYHSPRNGAMTDCFLTSFFPGEFPKVFPFTHLNQNNIIKIAYFVSTKGELLNIFKGV
jgi:hypothetical protein